VYATDTFFDGVLDLANLDGTNGFVINGVDAGDNSGYSVSSAGDVNGDGIHDVIIGAKDANYSDRDGAGEGYVIFGGNGVGSSGSFDPSTLDGTNGYVIYGVSQFDEVGESVSSAGDFNGDGIDDLMISSRYANNSSGETYVIYGGSDVGNAGSLDLANLNGTNGLVIQGVKADDWSGISVASAGDVNGDGFDDVIIGAELGGPAHDFRGESYVVFGGNNVGNSGRLHLADLDGANGFSLTGIDFGDYSGTSVSSAGDINGDGINDVIIGGWRANGYAGESYVVFGSNDVGASGGINLASLDGSNGFVFAGKDLNDRSGWSVAHAGDVNGDGIDDVIIGATGARQNGQFGYGESYIVFGVNSIGSTGNFDLSSLNGTKGFVLEGISAYDYTGTSVSSAGDVNGDGIDDVIIGAYTADPNGRSSAGQSYVVFGARDGLTSPLELSNLNGINGFTLNGDRPDDLSGFSVSSAGDFNHDGFDDVIVGAFYADPNGRENAGRTYIVFGQAIPEPTSLALLALGAPLLMRRRRQLV